MSGVVMVEIKIADHHSDVVLNLTPVDQDGKINGEVVKVAHGQPVMRYIHKSQNYVIGISPADRVELPPAADVAPDSQALPI